MTERRCRLTLIGTLFACVAGLHAQQLAITMDDLPVHGALSPGESRQDVARKVLAAFQEAKVPQVYGFINGVHLEQDPQLDAVLQMWRDAGYPLGNHTWSHLNLNEATPQQFETEIQKNEPVLQRYMRDANWRWLRFPYLSEGNTPDKRSEVRTWLASHHYRIAAVTMSFADYAFNDPYARCKSKGDAHAAGELERAYLDGARRTAEYMLAASRTETGRQVPLVLLMHIGTLDAAMMPRLLRMYQEMGFQFVTLEQAEKDPFYASDLDVSLPPGTMNLSPPKSTQQDAALALPAPPANLATVCR